MPAAALVLYMQGASHASCRSGFLGIQELSSAKARFFLCFSSLLVFVLFCFVLVGIGHGDSN
jgi:hypothetical protein